MIRLISSLALSGALLMGCGADGEPVQPTANVTIGVGSGGVHTGIGVGLTKGPFNILLGAAL